MKRTGNLYPQICDPDNIRAAILSASKGKRRRKDVQDVLDHIEERTAWLSEQLKAEAFTPSPYIAATVREGTKNKERQIKKPAFWPDQCVHWAIYNVIGPPIYKSFYSITCGSVPGRGVHYGKKFVERWLRRDRKHTRYYLKMDVHHFYPSVNIEMLKERLERKFKDKQLLCILGEILDQSDGLPIGVLLSQCFANFYLTPLDHFIKQQLGARYYIRYMDDMVIFGNNKKALHKMRREIAEWLQTAGLEMKGNWQVCKEDAEPLDFMGFRFYRNRTTLRRAIMLRITRRVRKVDHMGRAATPHDAAGVLSYMGWLKCTDTHAMFEKWVRPHLHIQRLKNILRKGQKRENGKIAKHHKAAGMGHGKQPGSGVP